MALTRAAVIKALDAGRWLTVENTDLGVRGDTTDVPGKASRYPSLLTLDSQIPTTNWYPNQWGDETKKLIDAANGYEIKDKFFSAPKGDPVLGVAPSPNVAGGQKSPNQLDRTAVLFSYDVGAYIYVYNPGDAPAAWNVEFVNSPAQATRFDNLVQVGTWLAATPFGQVTNGYGIEQYAFTKAQATAFPFQAIIPSIGASSITRAYVPFSNQEAAYLKIDNPGDPIANMTFQYVPTPQQGSRFQDLNDFKDIVDQRPDFFGTTFTDGWEVPQFYFTQTVKDPPGDPIRDFFENNPCGQLEFGGKFSNTYEQILATAVKYCYDWREFYNIMIYDVFGGKAWGPWADFDCFIKWYEAQDHMELENWLYKLWSATACG